MPIRIRLIRENGEIVESIADTDGLVERAMAELPDLRLLRYVDAYGDTYFNKLQMPDLLRDWNAAEKLAQSADDEACWRDLKRLAEECQRRTHLYLRFAGD
jgi:hypothetical protein